MKHEQFEVIRGSGNVYRDLGKDYPDLRQFKAILATENRAWLVYCNALFDPRVTSYLRPIVPNMGNKACIGFTLLIPK